MQIRFTTLAQNELAEARRWLNRQQPGLGRQLNEEVRQVAARMIRMPFLYPLETKEVRKCSLTRFHYNLRFYIQEEVIFVIAFSHQHRDPHYWVDRLPNQ